MSSGSFEAIVGPMSSGKSSEAILASDRHRYADDNVLIIHSSRNVREDDVTSRLGISRSSVKVKWLSEVNELPEFDEADVICVDEIHMFVNDDDPQRHDASDAFEAIKSWLELGIDVIVSGLDVLANSNLSKVFAELLRLTPDVRWVRAACEVRISPECERKDARHTVILTREGRRIPLEELPDVIPDDGSVIYKPACRPCFYGFVKTLP